MNKQKSPISINHILGSDKRQLQQISVKSTFLRRATHILANFMQENAGINITNSYQVSNYRDGILVIETYSPAIATRLNYMKLQLLTEFRQSFVAELSSIDIKVVPKEALIPQKEKKTTPRVLSESAAESLRNTASHVPEKLAKKLERLASLAQKQKN